MQRWPRSEPLGPRNEWVHHRAGGPASRRHRHATPSTAPNNAGGFVPDRPRRTAESQPASAAGAGRRRHPKTARRPGGQARSATPPYGCWATRAPSPAQPSRWPRAPRSSSTLKTTVTLTPTVHWHGLRLENRYDGVPHETQAPIPVGGQFPTTASKARTRCWYLCTTLTSGSPHLHCCTATSWSSPPTSTTGRRPTVISHPVSDHLLNPGYGKIAPFSPTDTRDEAMPRLRQPEEWFRRLPAPALHLPRGEAVGWG